MYMLMKRTIKILVPSLMLAFALIVITGCGGGKKAMKTTEMPAPQVTSTEPVAQPKPMEKAASESAKKELGVLSLENVYFDYDKYNLTPSALDILARHAQALKQYREIPVVIEGHCDERGTIEYNLALGEKRANAVKDYLVSLGIERSRLSTISYGKERPVDTRSNETAWARNRRAEFVIKTQPSLTDNY